MGGANLKAETMALMDKRGSMETEMNSIVERLCNPGGPGLSGNLVDSEVLLTRKSKVHLLIIPPFDSFIVYDIDRDSLGKISTFRRLELSAAVLLFLSLTELRNEHSEITDKIDVNIQILHSVRPTSRVSSTKDSGPEERSLSGEVASLSGISVASRAMDVDSVTSIPFAMVDEITESSPAAEDGLQLGDQVVKFGNVEGGDNLLQRLAAEVQASQGRAVSVGVIRQGAKLDLSVTPRVPFPFGMIIIWRPGYGESFCPAEFLVEE
ncbi:hypothetical protein Bca101_011066 [Brassica carinata]